MAIGTGLALLGGSLASSAIGASSAGRASRAQQNAANRDIQFQEETRDQIRADLDPFRRTGLTANNALAFELGLGPRPMVGGSAPQIETFTEAAPQAGQPFKVSAMGMDGGGNYGQAQPSTRYRVNGQVFNSMDEAQAYAGQNLTGGTEYGGFTKTPGYDFRMSEGTNALEAGAAARGGLYSGAAMKALQSFGQDYATSEYGNYLTRLQQQQGVGLDAASMNASASQNTASGVSNALGNLGNAQAAGAIGVGNAINTGIGNALGSFNYMRQVGGGAGQINVGRPGGLFGGSSWS